MIKQMTGIMQGLLFLLIVTVLLVFSADQQASESTTKERGDSSEPFSERRKPDFGSITDVKVKKSTFFSYMRPIVDVENQKIARDRVRLIAISAKQSLSDSDKQWLQSIAKRYQLPQSESLDKRWFTVLTERIDTLPVSLALAQSANESAWGTSRFARQGNNMFGQWCFVKGCGLVPKQRRKGAVHEVRTFASVSDSVAAYLLNINTHHQYADLRRLRAKARRDGKPVTGLYLSPGLKKYSERGEAYVNEVMAMISGNKLDRYDAAFDQSVNQNAG